MPEFSYPVGWTDISNQALRSLSAKLINSILDNVPNAAFCRQFMGKAVQQVLAEEDWACCTKREQLNQLTETPAFGFLYNYQLPTNLVRFLDDGIDTQGMDFSIERERLLTDATTVYVRYVAHPEDPAKLSSYVRNAISSQLAFLLCIPLESSEQKQGQIQGQYGIDLELARKAEGKAHKKTAVVSEELGFTWWDESR
jgi:hypothetical protein